MSDGRTVSGAVLDLLGLHGVDTCFGIPGVHNLGLWNALTPERPRIIGVRHEQAAGYACDGLYRATGRIGASLLTTGPGAANVVAAFGEAYMAHSPMLVLASDIGTGLHREGVTRGVLHEMRDQAAMFAAFGAHAVTARSAEAAVAAVADGLRRLQTAPGRPIYVGIPSNVLEQPWAGPIERVRPSDPDVDADVAPLAEAIDRSARIVLWLGGGVIAAGVEEEVRALAHRLGAVVVTSFAGRGLMAGDPHTVEVPVHEPEVGALLADADLLLVLGSDFDAMNTKNFKLALPAIRAVVTLGDQVANTVDWQVHIAADLRAALPALGRALDDRDVATRALWAPAASIRADVFARLRRDVRVHEAAAFVEALEKGWPQEDCVIGDMAVAGFWATLYAYQARPRRSHYPVGWGTLGYAVPAAIGPASQGIATLAVCGDGGPMFALGELATYAQESLPITLLVVDDGGYGMLRFDQQVFGHPERGVDLVTPDWVMLARSFGITGVAVSGPTQLPSALRAAREANGRGEPRLILWKHRLYPPATTSPRWFE